MILRPVDLHSSKGGSGNFSLETGRAMGCNSFIANWMRLYLQLP